jgi:hypothetical protein
MKTLHEKFVRMRTEHFLRKLGGCLSPSDDLEPEEEAEAAPIAPENLEQTVRKTIEETEQFFAHFGLAPERQEELFQMPIIQQGLDEVIAGVARERMELELEFGAPRNGWDPLPFEKSAETEKILAQLIQRKREEKIEEVHVDTIFDQSAQEQIAAIQQRLLAALEEVKNATQEQGKAMALPALPVVSRHESLAEEALALPDLRDKRPINADFKHHYVEQLKVVPSPQAPRTIAETQPIDRTITGNSRIQAEQPVECPVHSECPRTVEAITKNIEKMRSGSERKAGQRSEPSGTLSPDVIGDEEMPKMLRNVSTARANGIVISALKSKMQGGEYPAVIAEDGDRDGPNSFEGVALPGLPPYGNAGTGGGREEEAKSKMLLAHRRQMGPRRFQL